MALYTMADFHLSESTGKPMDIFGPVWENHSKKIAENWPLTENDAIVMPGDFSWAMTLEEVRADFEFLSKLKGRKILSKGNHDYWWSSMKKITEFAAPYGNISFLHNNSVSIEGISLCGTRGWIQEPGEAADIKVLKREAERLERSLLAAEYEPIVFLHYRQYLLRTDHGSSEKIPGKKMLLRPSARQSHPFGKRRTVLRYGISSGFCRSPRFCPTENRGNRNFPRKRKLYLNFFRIELENYGNPNKNMLQCRTE